MKSKKILIIVDGQNDFREGGKLPVEGGTEALNRVADFIREHGKEYLSIILTADWHPITHCSFKDNGGIWPPHCVEFSVGGAIYQPILDALAETNADYVVLTKGCDEDHEEYSIFKNDLSATYLKTLNNHNDIEVVDYAGLALDYCVKDSIMDGKKVFTKSKSRLFKDLTAAIGKPEETYDYLTNNEVEIV